MTREQAIEVLNMVEAHGSLVIQAKEMAIKALEQETCEDCISRVELLKAIDTWDKFGLDDTNHLFRLDNLSLPYYVPYIHYDDVVKCIKGMPSVTPQPKTEWTPCSEKMPKEGVDVLACFYTGEGNYMMMVSRRSDYNYWSGVGRTADMVAWMPLPEPYKEG